MSKLQIALDKLKRLNNDHVAEVGQIAKSTNGERTDILVTPVQAQNVFDANGIKVTHQVYRMMFNTEDLEKAGYTSIRGFLLFFKGQKYQSVQGNKGVGEDNAQLRGLITLNFTRING